MREGGGGGGVASLAGNVYTKRPLCTVLRMIRPSKSRSDFKSPIFCSIETIIRPTVSHRSSHEPAKDVRHKRKRNPLVVARRRGGHKIPPSGSAFRNTAPELAGDAVRVALRSNSLSPCLPPPVRRPVDFRPRYAERQARRDLHTGVPPERPASGCSRFTCLQTIQTALSDA